MIEFSSLRDMSAGLANRDFSSVELTQDHLTRIQTADSDINSFVTVNPELALAQAARADQRRAAGDQQPTVGLPFAHKDIFCTDGVLTTAGSKMLSKFIALTMQPWSRKWQKLAWLALAKPTWTSLLWARQTKPVSSAQSVTLGTLIVCLAVHPAAQRQQ